MKVLYLFFCLFFLTIPSYATFVAVLETAADGRAKESVPFTDRQYLTNVLRGQAVRALPANQNWTIMTRENIMQMLPPGKSIEDCEGSCLVETGKNIAADFVCQARVGALGNWLTLSVELYETAGNKLVASFNGRGMDVEALLDLVKQRAPEFFSTIKNPGNFAVAEKKDVVRANEDSAPIPSAKENAIGNEGDDAGVNASVDANASVDKNASKVHTHRGFYFSSSLTFGYTYLRRSGSSKSIYGVESLEYKFEGISLPYAEIRFGGSIANTLSIYGMLGVGFGLGDFDYEDSQPYNSSSYDVKLSSDATLFRFVMGFGFEYYPVKDKESVLYGLFLGVSLGLSFDEAFFDSDGRSSYRSDHQEGFLNYFARFEAGKDWWISDRWSAGFALNYAIGSADDLDSENVGTDIKKSYASHVIGLTFRINH